MNAVDIDAASICDGHNVSTIRADCHCGNGVFVGTYMEKQLASVNVDEAHDAILTQYAENLQREKQTAHEGLGGAKWSRG